MENITLAAIQENYIQAYSQYREISKALESKIDRRNKQITRLQERLKKHGRSFPRWTEILLRPVLNGIKEQLPGWEADDEQLNPMGLGCRVSVFFHPVPRHSELKNFDPDLYIYIVFMPGDLDKGELLFQTGEQEQRFAPGTIGEINGFNYRCKKLDSISEAVNHLQKQINILNR